MLIGLNYQQIAHAASRCSQIARAIQKEPTIGHAGPSSSLSLPNSRLLAGHRQTKQQQQRQASADTARRLAEKKRPGRPCKQPAAAATAASSSVASLDEEPAEKKRKSTHSGSTLNLIHDILSASRETNRSTRAHRRLSLQRRFPRLPSQSEGRFGRSQRVHHAQLVGMATEI